MGPTNQPPPPSTPTAALSLLLSKKALDASRTEILVLASGVLFLASQVCLLVWILRRTGAAPATAPDKKEGRKVSIVLPAETIPSSPATDDAQNDDANATGDRNSDRINDSLVRLRRSSTWGGRSSHPGSRPRGRRKSAGPRRKAYDHDNDGNEEDETEKQGAQTSLSSPGPEPEPEPQPEPEPSEAGRAALATAFGDMIRVSAAQAAQGALSLRPGGGEDVGAATGGGGGGAEDTELSELGPRRAWGEASNILDAPVEKPPSPRSPRVLAADQAAMMDALYAEEGAEAGDSKAAAPSPVGDVRRDSLELTSGFDDPLGVNRLVALPREDEEDGPEEVELELREGERGL